MHREPVNPDDPQMTAYALGELTIAEAAEFEARLQDSPKARRELAEMRQVMSLLSEGLRGEWQGEAPVKGLRVFEPVLLPEPAPDSVIIEGRFRPVRRSLAAAAAVAAILLFGAAALVSQRSGLLDGNPVKMLATVENPVASSLAGSLPVSSLHVPQLLLADEIEDPSSLDLVGGGDAEHLPVDASYLESDAIIPASFHPTGGGVRLFSSDRAVTLDRVDSYLPPLGGLSTMRNPATGMIERRLGRGLKEGAAPSSSVLVSGYVTMGGGESGAPRVQSGFRPVSISGNPVVNEESDLRLLADLNGLKKDLSVMINEMPSHSEERAGLERALERSERIASQLKRELAR
jgi:hypothetical protein